MEDSGSVLVTGISGGIGFAVARRLLGKGRRVVGVDLAKSDAVRDACSESGGHLSFKEANLADSSILQSLVEEVVEESGPLSGFVHCAGFDRMSPLHMLKAREAEDLWRLHALAPMLLLSAISRKKNHADGCSVVLVSSQSAHEGAMGHVAYASAKGAVEGLVAPAAAELMERGMRINCVCLGPVRTGMSARWMDRLGSEEMERLLSSYPLGLGTTDDASTLICFLLSDESRWINGQIVVADGGHSVRKV